MIDNIHTVYVYRQIKPKISSELLTGHRGYSNQLTYPKWKNSENYHNHTLSVIHVHIADDSLTCANPIFRTCIVVQCLNCTTYSEKYKYMHLIVTLLK